MIIRKYCSLEKELKYALRKCELFLARIKVDHLPVKRPVKLDLSVGYLINLIFYAVIGNS